MLCGCDEIPHRLISAPKDIEADGHFYLACEGYVRVYSPSRNVVSSTSRSYEIVFTDDYGKAQDITSVSSYTITDAPKDASYAMSSLSNPENLSTTYSDGSKIKVGSDVLWGNNGDAGRARWNGPGKWSPVPCS
jgi:hypothetical protein